MYKYILSQIGYLLGKLCWVVGVCYQHFLKADKKMTQMYENYLKKYAFYDNSPSGTNGITGYDNVKSGLAGVAKIDGVVSIGVEKKPKTVILSVYYRTRINAGNEVLKRDISPTDAMAFLAHIKGDKNAVRLRSTNVKKSMTEETVRDAYNAVLLQVALVMGGQDKVGKAEEELQSYLAQETNEEKHFDAEALLAVACYFYRQENGEPTKKKDVPANSRMRTLAAMKNTPSNATLIKAVKDAGYPVEIIAEASKYFFVQSKVDKDGEIEDRYTLRKSEKNTPPSYMDDKTKVTMRVNGDRLYYVDPRNPEDKPVTSKAAGGIVIKASRGAVNRGDDKELEEASAYLLTKGYTQGVLDQLSNKLIKQTAKDLSEA